MKRTAMFLVIALLLGNQDVAQCADPHTELATQLTSIVRKHFKDAEVTDEKGVFTAKYGTMKFTIHPESYSGNSRKQTTQEEEGPNTEGFLLEFSVRPKEVDELPSNLPTFREPYWDRYSPTLQSEDGASCYEIRFLSGRRLDQEFYKAIIQALPKNQVGQVATPTFPLAERLSVLVKKHYPDATIEHHPGRFVAKHGTMPFTVHHRFRSGEYSESTSQEEGPNFKGFELDVSVCEGPYAGMLSVPQTLHYPYWNTLIDAQETEDAPATKDGMGHYHIALSFGRQLDEAFKKELSESLPRAIRFEQRR